MIFNCQAVFFSILVCCLITTLPFSYSYLNTLRNIPTKQKKVPLPAFLLPKSHTEAIILQIIVYAEVKKGTGALKLLQIIYLVEFSTDSLTDWSLIKIFVGFLGDKLTPVNSKSS